MKHTTQKAFTLIEMLSVLAIFSVITSVVVFNYGKFRSDTILVNMAYEVALSVREAQIYGVAARGSSTSFDVPYGIYFIKDSNQYYLFADNNLDGTFSGTSCTSTGGDTCVTPYTLQRNTKVTKISYPNPSDKQCPNSISTAQAGVIFKRPDPEPYVFIKNRAASENYLPAFLQIELTASNNTKRYVIMYANGQVAVLNEDQCTK